MWVCSRPWGHWRWLRCLRMAFVARAYLRCQRLSRPMLDYASSTSMTILSAKPGLCISYLLFILLLHYFCTLPFFHSFLCTFFSHTPFFSASFPAPLSLAPLILALSLSLPLLSLAFSLHEMTSAHAQFYYAGMIPQHAIKISYRSLNSRIAIFCPRELWYEMQ